MEYVIPTVESGGDTSLESQQKRRRKSEDEEKDTRRPTDEDQARRGAKRWRTEREQQIYSSKLVQALRRRSEDTGKISDGSREIHDTADRVLAASARGKTRWSRAILASRVRAMLRKHTRAKLTGHKRSSRLSETSTERPTKNKLPAIERKLKILGRLVPGCRKVPVPNLLEEATDYIAALEMQVRAMTALAGLLAAAPPSPPSTEVDGG